MGHVLGAEKGIFLIRGAQADAANKAAAPVESCQSMAHAFPRGRLGSLVDVRNRLHRMRRASPHNRPIISTSRPTKP